MERYVNQLIEDIQDAAHLAPESFKFSSDDIEFMAQIIEAENTPPISSEKLMGLMYIQFPPSDRLTIRQMIDLNKAIERTLVTFRVFVELPGTVPVSLRYEMIRGLFKEDFQIKKGLNTHLDFCSGNCAPCSIADYCGINIENKKRAAKQTPENFQNI
jgi:hypothetical protein